MSDLLRNCFDTNARIFNEAFAADGRCMSASVKKKTGRKVLRCLKHAFFLGLMLMVKESLNTLDCKLSLKTSTRYGLNSYPDDSYFPIINEELDNLRVPSAMQLRSCEEYKCFSL